MADRSALDAAKIEAAIGNRILAEVALAVGVRASLGHVSMRVPGDPNLFVVKGRGYRMDVLSCMRPEDYDYIDFYMGTIWIAQRADLTPVYQMISRRLKAYSHDWVYYFPRLGIVDLRPLRETLHQQEDNAWESATYTSEEDEQQDRAIAELRASLDSAHYEAVEAARHQPPPPAVQAYHSVYGRFPDGWPPIA
jgi:hypothetical protein